MLVEKPKNENNINDIEMNSINNNELENQNVFLFIFNKISINLLKLIRYRTMK